MRTEFLIPFEIDTSVIEAKLEGDAYDEIVRKLTDGLRTEVEGSLPKKYGRIDWDRVAWTSVEKFLEDHADEIIDTTVLLLAQKVGNKKRWRDVLNEIKKEREED